MLAGDEFGGLMAGLRRTLGLTQEALADRSGVSVRTIRNLEAGRVGRPRPASVSLLAGALELTGPQRSRFELTARGADLGPQFADTPVMRSPAESLVGRKADLAYLLSAVPKTPLVVLTGPGGTGKTRLAIAAADLLASGFPDGVGVAELGMLAAGAVVDQFLDATAKLRGEIAATNLTYLPIATYSPVDPVNGYGDYFNIDMTRSLEKTSFYAFRGPSARYVAARLRRARSYPQEVRVAMLNPGDSAAISRRSSDRLQWLRSEGKTAADLERELHDELINTVVSLFDYRKICPVQLLYVEDTAVYRYEMFDDSVFVSWYHGPQSAGRRCRNLFDSRISLSCTAP
jgi:transcriptional regulator with XRE-family HTH domain